MKNKTMLNRRDFLKLGGAGLAGATLLGVAGCGGGGGGSSGPKVSVGSKKFTEQILLGEMYAQAFADKGYDVTRQLNLGSEQVMDKSLQDGTIDVYPEYTGTAYVAILGKPPDSYPKTEKETYEQVAKFYKNREDTPMQMLTPAPFNNNYVIVMLTKTAEEMGITNLENMAAKSGGLIFSSYSEFQNRSDGYDNMKQNYPKLDFEDITIVNDIGIRYKAIAEGEADVGIGFETDGQLLSPKLRLLKDPKVIWPKYYPAPVVVQSFLDKNPDGKKILDSVSASLSTDKMRALNGAVDLEQKDYEDVARQHLEEAGIVSN